MTAMWIVMGIFALMVAVIAALGIAGWISHWRDLRDLDRQ